MNVWHECRGEMALLVRTEKRLRYNPTIRDMMDEPPGAVIPKTIKYWQPFACRDCSVVVYELRD